MNYLVLHHIYTLRYSTLYVNGWYWAHRTVLCTTCCCLKLVILLGWVNGVFKNRNNIVQKGLKYVYVQHQSMKLYGVPVGQQKVSEWMLKWWLGIQSFNIFLEAWPLSANFDRRNCFCLNLTRVNQRGKKKEEKNQPAKIAASVL